MTEWLPEGVAGGRAPGMAASPGTAAPRVVVCLAGRVVAGLNGLARRLADAVLPPLCVLCRADVEAPGCLCAACWGGIAFIGPPCCERLGTPFAHHPGGPLISPEALARPPAYHRARAVAAYDGVARDLVHRLKYGDRLDIAGPMARMMARAGIEVLDGADVLVPVPLHGLRLWHRRFNQSAMLARGIGRESGIAVEPGWLERHRSTAPQVRLDRAARAANVAGAFRVPEAAKAEIAGRRLVLVDDVLTTGATLDACAKALLRAGAGTVDVLVFARVVEGTALPLVDGDRAPIS
ncbi:ComF family protein [Ancylobacter sp. 6x-1]|uniref:ComF family protein n=1 Tax=Ancylobacter crimeensis TaxID=2579147 RepID=A0ABT0DER8_9HYPH|nr:ComF family protein [Ancylobacter crimeensis]MCK0198458.1 ComF family protein [Ancylobacter crimeensis]